MAQALTQYSLYDRRYQLTIGNLQLIGQDRTGMNVAFKVEKTTKKEPNKFEIGIWNLNADHRDAITKGRVNPNASKNDPIHVELIAGYKDNSSLIFSGDLNNAWTDADGPSLVTKLTGTDGGHQAKQSRINKSYPPGTPLRTLATDLVGALRLGGGNLNDYISQLTIPGIGNSFQDGHALSGSAWKEFDHIIRSSGFEWSVQAGNVQIKPIGQSLTIAAILINKASGMIDSPKKSTTPSDPTKKGKTESTVEVETFLIPSCYPGRLAKLQSDTFNGVFQMTEVVTAGEFRGRNWGHQLKLRALS